MPHLHHITAALPFSPWLARHWNNGLLDSARLVSWIATPRGAHDFAQFADWEGLLAAENEDEIARQLRLLRRDVMAGLIVRDINRLANLAEITHTITEFADFSVNIASRFAEQYYRGLYGEPLGQYSGAPQYLSVVAMGKAGGFELNVSSDIDLIFVFPESGETNGRRARSNQEFFTKVGQKIIALLDDITADGRVFRVDMRLRPDGDSGALVLSETALEQYLMTQGREWERYAWCKARVITPYANDIAAIVRPFVFRKYLDFHAYDGMRALRHQIQQEVQKRDLRDNIKLGAGGIREIEFIAQVFQMIRGGQQRALQLKGTQETLRQLAKMQILPEDIVVQLLESYVFLRDLEHRLQYWNDEQTQTLPEDSQQRLSLVQSMGFDDEGAFLCCLKNHRDRVHQAFGAVLYAPESAPIADNPLAQLWANADDARANTPILAHCGFRQPEEVARCLAVMKNSSRYRHLSTQAQPRFDALIPQLLAQAAECANPDETLARLLDFLGNIGRRSVYLAFLQQYPAALKQLVALMSQSAWIAQYLLSHPALLDELLSAQLMLPTDWARASDELGAMLAACDDDVEAKWDTLRRFKHAHTFRLAVQDLEGLWRVETLSDELSVLADTVLRHTVSHVWQSIAKTHQAQPQFAVIAYGKLGGKELGYTSDLDLVFLFDDAHPDAVAHYRKLAMRMGTWLSGSTGAGTLYDLDLRLRPNGEDGALVHRVGAFAQYQHQNAWTWEHQALTRARFVCGDAAIGEKFEHIRREILTMPRDRAVLRADILAMREKIAHTHAPKENDVKYARGGIVDVEFIVQYWILAHAREHAALLENHGNIALLLAAAQCGLVAPEMAQRVAQAYRAFRHLQHQANVRDWSEIVVDDALRAHYSSVRALWERVFADD